MFFIWLVFVYLFVEKCLSSVCLVLFSSEPSRNCRRFGFHRWCFHESRLFRAVRHHCTSPTRYTNTAVGHSNKHVSTEEATRNSTLTAQHDVLECNTVKFGRPLTLSRNVLRPTSVQDIFLENGGGRRIRNAVTYVSKYTASRPGTPSRWHSTAVPKLKYHKNGSHLERTCRQIPGIRNVNNYTNSNV